MTITTISAPGAAVIRAFEGRSLKAYKDEVGVVTIGYGTTNYDKEDLKAVLGIDTLKMGQTITEAQAEALLQRSISGKYGKRVTAAFAKKMGAPLTQAQWDAGASFDYNTGAINRATWVKNFVAQAAPAVINSGIMSWNKAGGKVLAGLTRRRAREWAMLSRGEYGSDGKARPLDLSTNKPVTSAPSVVEPTTTTGTLVSSDRPGLVPVPPHLEQTTGMLHAGMVGPEVKELQDRLNLPQTGTFDDRTVAAVTAFQKAHPQLTVDGVVGPATRAALARVENMPGTITKTVIGVAAGGGAGASLVSTSTLLLVLVALAAIGFIGYKLWQNRDEIVAAVKRAGAPK